MNLYEVIFWGAEGRDDDADTIYLARAPDYRSAVEFVSTNASPSDHGGQRFPLAHVVYELGSDASPHAETSGTAILRGPYFQCAYNFGWRAWNRKIEGSDYSQEWEEETHVV